MKLKEIFDRRRYTSTADMVYDRIRNVVRHLNPSVEPQQFENMEIEEAIRTLKAQLKNLKEAPNLNGIEDSIIRYLEALIGILEVKKRMLGPVKEYNEMLQVFRHFSNDALTSTRREKP